MTWLLRHIVVIAGLFVLTGGAANADTFKVQKCSAAQSAKVEQTCAQRNIWHARGTLQWIQTQRSRTLQVLPVDTSVLLALSARKRDMTWLLSESLRRKSEAARRLTAYVPNTDDWLTAVRLVQRIFPGSEGWLIACSSSEGSHGAWVPNAQGSGAGGWMQYMEGTFWGDYNQGLAYARAHGFVIPSATASWHSALGQAIAAGWAYGHNRPSGKWTGTLC